MLIEFRKQKKDGLTAFEVNGISRSVFDHEVWPTNTDPISDRDRDVMTQFLKAGPVPSLVAGVTLSMLEEGTDVAKLGLAVRALVLIVLVPSVGVVSGLVTTVGDAVQLVTVDATIAFPRFQMDQHSGGCCEASFTTITFHGERGVYFAVLVNWQASN